MKHKNIIFRSMVKSERQIMIEYINKHMDDIITCLSEALQILSHENITQYEFLKNELMVKSRLVKIGELILDMNIRKRKYEENKIEYLKNKDESIEEDFKKLSTVYF